MDNEIYLIHLDDYLGHIDGKLEMYDLLLELVRSLRHDLEAGETAQAVRTLCAYEQQAHNLYENWNISDIYAESGDPDDLAQLMEDELLPAWDEGEDSDIEDDGVGEDSAAVRLLRIVGQLTESTHNVLAVANEIMEFEKEADHLMDGDEKPENACAG